MWMYQGREVDEDDIADNVGFVYMITNLSTGRRYIGKKLLAFTRTKKAKGAKRGKKVKTESDWKSYFGSNKALAADVEKLGEARFSREILRFCKTKGTTNYFEMKFQIQFEVLESDQWYNDHIWVRVHRSHIKK